MNNTGILKMNGYVKRARLFAGLALAISAILGTAGCGVAQAVKDSTVSVAQWIFTTRVRAMNVDLAARTSMNEDAGGRPLSTVVRLYQLKDTTTFSQLSYVQLQTNDLELLKADLLATKDVVMRPGASASVSEPMNKDAQAVGVVAFFREPSQDSVWKLTIPKKQWKATDPVKIEVSGRELVLVGANPEPVTRQAPQQSAPPQRSTPPQPAG